MNKLFFEGQCKRGQSQAGLNYAECSLNSIFYQLIRVAVGQATCLSHTPKYNEWLQLYEMAKKQSLIGICFAGVHKLQAQRQAPNSWGDERGELLYLQWMGMAAKIQQRNEVVNRQCAELRTKLAADGLSCVVLKGQGNALLYGDLHNLRQSGDIDAWVNAPVNDVMKYVNSIAPTREVTHQHVHFHIFEDTEVELHFVPSELECFANNRRLQKFYNTQKELIFDSSRLAENELGFSTPTTKFNLVFQLSHIYRHLFGEGIGLRQVIDYYYLLKSSSLEERIEAFDVIRKTGMARFCTALMYVLDKIFGLEPDYYLCSEEEKSGKVLLEDILTAGNFGAARERTSNDNWWKRTVRFTRQNAHLLKYYPSEVLWDPVWRLWHFAWRKRHGYE